MIKYGWKAMAVLLLMMFAHGAQAAWVDPQIAVHLAGAPDAAVPVIVTLQGPAEPLAVLTPPPRVRSLSRGERRDYRAGLIRALQERSATSRRGLREQLLNQGVPRVTDLWLINGLALTATPELIAALAANPEVAEIKYARPLQLPRAIPAVDSNLNQVEDNLDLLRTPELWALGYTGQNVTVAIIDSGVDLQHPDLVTRWRGGANSWFNPVASRCGTDPAFTCTACDANTSTPCDYLDAASGVAHGTGVAGVAVGGDASGKAIGVAPGAQWIAAKIFRSDDLAAIGDIHAVFQWLLDPDGNPATDDAPDVVNASWGFQDGQCLLEFSSDIQALKLAGIAVVFSAGNSGPGPATSVSPANYPEGFAVGSVGNSFLTQSTAISDFSSRGPSACDDSVFPEVVAPGYVRTAAVPSVAHPSQYIGLAGTSFSAPEVAGVMALLLSADPALTVAELEQVLSDAATDLGTAGPDNDYGNGLVDARAAFDLLNLTPQLGIVDAVPPVNDGLIAFGETGVGTSSEQDLTLTNIGGGTLNIGALDLGNLADPFTLVSDLCTGASLATGQSCTLRVRFAPLTEGSFLGSFLISSNDVNTPAQVTVTGQGVAAPPAPQLLISDASGASGDRAVAFDQVAPGTSAVATVTFANGAGAGPLLLEGFDTSLLPAIYSVIDGGPNPCGVLPKTLLAGQSCTVQVRFAPLVVGTSSGSFLVQSNDQLSTAQVSVTGFSNTPPPVPQLLSPASQATAQPTTLTLSWRQAPDSDANNTVSNRILLGRTPDLHDATVINVTGSVLPATGAALVLIGILAGLPAGFSRRLRWLVAVVLTLAVLVACGGGGGGDTVPQVDPDLRSQTVNGLLPGTTYYWQVQALDNQGGTSSSPIRSFSTQ